MKDLVVSKIKDLTRHLGFDVVKYRKPAESFPPDFDSSTIETIIKVQQYTATSSERLFALCEAVRYVVKSKIPGEIVECGVWKGGSMMAVAYTLLSLKEDSPHLYLFDTFEGMAPPSQKDIDFAGTSASEILRLSQKEDKNSFWCYEPLKEVEKAMLSVGYPKEKVHFIKGKVENTLPEQAPQSISLLRLDTDWYESTRHELIHLFPRLSPGGVIIIDDYGHWKGAREAVDEYIQEHKVKLLLNRIDYTGRIGIKSNV